jgi:ATP-dependent Lhr-like helicase
LALPLMVERLRERLTTETLEKRLGRMLAELEAAAGGDTPLPLAEQLRFGLDAAQPPKKRAPRRRR